MCYLFFRVRYPGSQLGRGGGHLLNCFMKQRSNSLITTLIARGHENNINTMSIIFCKSPLPSFYYPGHTPNSDEVHMDLVNDGTWEHSGEQLNFKGGWMDGQPNNWTGPQDCATLFADGWNDRSCNFNIPFLCEINIEN